MGSAQARPANLEDVPGIAASWAAAFRDDPLWSWIVSDPDTERRLARLTRFFAASARQWTRHSIRELWTTPDLAGGAAWARPGEIKEPATAMLAAVPAMVRSLGRGLGRSLSVYKLVLQRRPAEPHWYLEIIGTRPEAQGRGIATALMASVLDRCDRTGISAYLETQKESNVPFYERRGFRVTGELDLPGGGPHMWLMLRPPS